MKRNKKLWRGVYLNNSWAKFVCRVNVRKYRKSRKGGK